MVPPPLGGGDGVGGLVLSREAKASFRTPPPSAVLVLPSIVKLPSKEMDPVFEKPPPASAVLFWSTLSMRYAVPSLNRPPPCPLAGLPSRPRSVPVTAKLAAPTSPTHSAASATPPTRAARRRTRIVVVGSTILAPPPLRALALRTSRGRGT